MVFEYSQSRAIKLCYKPYRKEENKDSSPLNFKRPYTGKASLIFLRLPVADYRIARNLFVELYIHPYDKYINIKFAT